MLFEHENGNWKNSQVARNLVDLLEQPEVEAEPTPADPAPVIRADDSLVIADAEEAYDRIVRGEFSHLIINDLNSMVSTAGSQVAANEIELAIEDIKQILK